MPSRNPHLINISYPILNLIPKPCINQRRQSDEKTSSRSHDDSGPRANDERPDQSIVLVVGVTIRDRRRYDRAPFNYT